MKKFLIGSLTALTVMWGVGLAAIVAVPANAAVGDLVKSASSNTVYVVKSDGVTICQFPHANVYSSWGYPSNFGTVMTKDLSSYTVGSNVEFRDASLVKGDGSAVYMVYNGMKRPIVSDVVFLALGYDWDDITWLSDAFLADYTTGSDVNDSSMHPDGQIVKYASDPAVYLIDGGLKRPFQSASAFEDNRFSWGNIITIPDTETYGNGAAVTGYEAGLSLPNCIGTGVTPAGSGLTVALSAATPAAASIIEDDTNGGQALVPFTTVNFTASSDGDVKVTTLKFKRTGISSDTTLSNLYLYNGSTKLTDGGSLSSGVVTFNNASGLFTVPAGTTMAVTIKGDVDDNNASSGQTIGFQLASASDVSTNGAAVSGSFPASGNLMTVANVTDLGKVYITTSSVATSVDPDTQDVEVWKGTFYTSNQNMSLNYLKLTSLGSLQYDDLSNFRLYDGGTLVGTATMNEDREVIFDLSGSPLSFNIGQSKLLKVLADVDKGSTRTYNFTIQEATDVVMMDKNYGVYVMPYPGYLTVGNWAVIKMATDTTIGSGSLSVTKKTTSPTGNVSQDGTNVSFGIWELKATGEDMKVKNFDVLVDTSGYGGLDNGKLYYNGVQVGSTKDLTEDTDVNFTFGSSLIVGAGVTGDLELKADVKTTTSTQIADGVTITASIGTGSSNVQKMSSLDYTSAPTSDVPANQLAVSAGSLTVSEYTGYGDQNMVAGTTGAKVASAVFQAGSSEGVNVTSITVYLSSDEYASTTNLMLMKGGVQLGTTKVTPTATNIFSVNFDIPASGSAVVDIYADFKSGSNAGPWTSGVGAEGNGLVTSNAVTGGLTSTGDNMQTMTLATGSLAFTSAASKPVSDIVVAGSSKVLLNAVKFSALYEAFEVQEVTVSTTAGMLDSFGKVYLEYPTMSGTGTAEGYLVSNTVTFTGLSMYVPKDDDAVLNIYADINTITGGADSGDEGDLTLAVNNSQTFKAVGKGSGTVDSNPDDSSGLVQSQVDVAGNDMVVRKTRPTVTLATLPTTTLSNGTKTISKFTVTADAAEDVSLYELEWEFATSGAVMTLSSAQLYDNANPGTALTASGTPAFTHTSGGTIKYQLNSEQVITAGSSKTYFLTVSLTGSDGDDSLLTRLATPYTTTVTGTAYDAAVSGTFVWSDNSASSHSYTSSDWANAEFVKTLPSDYQTLSN